MPFVNVLFLATCLVLVSRPIYKQIYRFILAFWFGPFVLYYTNTKQLVLKMRSFRSPLVPKAFLSAFLPRFKERVHFLHTLNTQVSRLYGAMIVISSNKPFSAFHESFLRYHASIISEIYNLETLYSLLVQEKVSPTLAIQTEASQSFSQSIQDLLSVLEELERDSLLSKFQELEGLKQHKGEGSPQSPKSSREGAPGFSDSPLD